MGHEHTPLRFGILGASRIAPKGIIGPARRIPGVRVDAVAARDATRAAAFARRNGIPNSTASYADLLDDPAIDAVYIALPNSLHAEWAVRALNAGKYVLCEKPLASNAEEAARIAAAAARPGAPLFMEAFHNRYHPLVKRMRAIVTSGELGALRSLSAVFRTPMLRRNDIRFEYSLAGGATMDLGCYMVNLVRYVTGEEPIVVRAEATLLAPEVDRRMQATLGLTSGATASIDVEMQARRFFDIRFVAEGEKGQLSVVNPVLPSYLHLFGVSTEHGRRREWFPRTASYDYQLRAFVDGVKTGSPIATDAADGLLTMRVLDAIYEKAGLLPRGRR